MLYLEQMLGRRTGGGAKVQQTALGGGVSCATSRPSPTQQRRAFDSCSLLGRKCLRCPMQRAIHHHGEERILLQWTAAGTDHTRAKPAALLAHSALLCTAQAASTTCAVGHFSRPGQEATVVEITSAAVGVSHLE